MKKFVALAALGLAALFVVPPAPAAAQRVGGFGGFGRVGGFGGVGRIGGFGRVGGFGVSPRFNGGAWGGGYIAPRARFNGWAPRITSVRVSGYSPFGWPAPARFYRRDWRAGSYYPYAGPSYGYPYAVYYP
jgi:hypothetical protein